MRAHISPADQRASKVEAASLERYLSDEDLRFAIERNLITIGEAMVCVRDHDPETLVRIPDYRGAIGLRNVVVHDYHRSMTRESGVS